MVKTKPKQLPAPDINTWMEQRAERNADILLAEPAELTWGRPTIEEHQLATFAVWRTLCNRYMVARVLARYSGDHRFNAYTTQVIELHHGGMDDRFWVASGRVPKYSYYDIPIHLDDTRRPKDYRTLMKALDVVHKYHCEENGISEDEFRSNDSEIIGHAVTNGLAELPFVVVAQPGRRRATENDRFGTPVGTDKAKFNAALTTTLQTMAEILEKAGLEGTQYNHLNKFLIPGGYVVKEGNKYKLKGE